MERARNDYMLNIAATLALCIIIPSMVFAILYGIDREVEIRESRLSDFCKAHPQNCDVATALTAPRAAGMP
jgi:hypothetical protein